MNKMFYALIGLVLVLGLVTATNYSEPNSIHDVLIHPEKYDRLPDNLTPYQCDNGVVDLDRAANDIKKGLNPSVIYFVDKDSLNCGDN